jgi:hypothetical protein
MLRYDAGREDAHRILMWCYAALDQRVQAMRQYMLCERLLQDEFDAVREPATRALYDRLRLDLTRCTARREQPRSQSCRLPALSPQRASALKWRRVDSLHTRRAAEMLALQHDLDGHLGFPLKARCVAERATSPLRVGTSQRSNGRRAQLE